MKRLLPAGVVLVALAGGGCQGRRASEGPSPSPPAAAPPAPAASQAAAPPEAPPRGPVGRHGAPLGGAPAVPLASLLANPGPHVGKTVTLEGPVRQACTRKGCWMEIASAAKGPGVRVRFKDYGFFVPTDAAGSVARVEGEVKVAELSEEWAAHWASEGAQIPRGADGKPREVQLVATGVELRRPGR